MFYDCYHKTDAVLCRMRLGVEGLHTSHNFGVLDAWLYEVQFTCVEILVEGVWYYSRILFFW